MTSSYVGRLPGHVAVDSNGCATYAIPLQLPPGTAGTMPSLKLAYNSGAGDDVLGVGWRLHGLSAITRVGATVAQDGFFGSVTYGAGDRFALDGQRLVTVAGTSYQDPHAVYHTELESWQKAVPVYKDTPSRSGPDAFLVYAKDGKCLEYGTTPDAQIVASTSNPSIRVWALNKITDLNGNYLTISYEQDEGSYYPLRIDYTGNEGLRPQRSVRFTYAARTDVVPKFLGGYPVRIAKLLTDVATYLGEALVLSYALAYERGGSTGRNRLTSVTLKDAQGVQLSPTVFDWQDGDPAVFDAAQSLPAPGVAAGAQLLPMDVNGDGLIDLVVASATDDQLELSIRLAKSDGSGFEPAVQVPTTGLGFGGRLLPMDVNGDGCIDLVYAVDNGGKLGLTVFLAEEKNGKWTLVQGPTNGAGPAGLSWGGQLLALDVDGDGRTDLVYVVDDDDTVGLKILFSDGTRFAPSPDDRTAPTLPYGGQWLPLDISGDGMTDLICVANDDDKLALTLFLSQGRQGLAQQADSPLPPGTSLTFTPTVLPMDLNGNGRDDLILAGVASDKLQLTPLLANGIGFDVLPTQSTDVPAEPGSLPHLLPMEVNGDGLTDLVVAAPSKGKVELTVLVSTGRGFSVRSGVTQSFAAAAWGGHLLPLDLNGDGLTDLLYATTQGEQIQLARALVGGAYPDLLTTITNGLGGQIALTYKPMTDPSAYAKGTAGEAQIEAQGLFNNHISGATYALSSGAAPAPGVTGATYATRTVDFPKYLLAGYVKKDGRGGAYAYKHFYEAAKLDLNGRGWLGFASMRATDTSVGTVTTTSYNQPFPHTSTVSETLVARATDGAWMKRTTFSYLPTQATAAATPVFVAPSRVETDFFTFASPQSKPDATHVKTHSYDDYGNPTLTADAGTSTLYTLATYQNDATNWRLGYKTGHKEAADSKGRQVLTWQKMSYDPKTWNQVKHQVWNDQSKSWLPTTFGYDQFGNRLTTTDPSGATSTVEYDSTYHTFAVKTTSPPNADGKSLVTTSTYFPQFGHEQSHTDANGIVHRQSVDGLGRPTGVWGPDPSGDSVQLTETGWVADGNGIYQSRRTRLDWAGKQWTWRHTYHDGLGRKYRTATLGPDGTTTALVDRSFDSRGHVVRQSLPYFEGATPAWIERSYDAYGRLTRKKVPGDGGTTVTEIDYLATDTSVRTQAVGTPQARRTRFEHGLFNSKQETVKKTDATGAVTTFGFDPLGRMISVQDPAGVTNTVTFDSLKRHVALRSTFAGATLSSESYAYEDTRRQVTHTDANGAKITLSYDSLHRLIAKSVTGGQSVTLAYDDPQQPLAMGRLASVSSDDGTKYVYGYDSSGHRSAISLDLAGMTYEIKKTYTSTGKVQTLTYPDGAALTNGYNGAGHLTSVSLAESGGDATTFATYSQFTAFGDPQLVGYGNGTQARFTYNAAGQLKSQTLASGQSTLLDESMSRNPLNALVSITDQSEPANSQSFSYDPVGRLAGATGAYPAQTYEYDPSGNMTLKDGITYAYEGYRIQTGTKGKEKVFSAAFDRDGNMTERTRAGKSVSYTYDNERRLVNAGATSFAYDHTGRRVVKKTPKIGTTYYVAPYYEVTVLPGGGSLKTKYLPGRFAAVTTAEGQAAADGAPGVPVPGTSYYFRNHIQSTTLQTDATGAVVTRVGYMPFGEIQTIEGPDSFRDKFTGKELDPETGLYYFHSRYYDPVIGRFITADDRAGGSPDMPDVFNRYCYALNSPVNFVDPTGHGIFSDIGDVLSGTFKALEHPVAGFFTGDVKHFFTNRIAETVISFVVDGVLIAGGIAILATTPFGGPASTILGSTLIGAGLGGLMYNITTLAEHHKFNWGQWGIQLGIGGATGLIGGAFAAGAGAVVDTATAAALPAISEDADPIDIATADYSEPSSFQKAFEPGGLGRMGVNTTASMAGGGGGNAVGQVLNNLAAHRKLTTGLAGAVGLGVGSGFLAGLASEGIARLASRTTTALSLKAPGLAGEFGLGTGEDEMGYTSFARLLNPDDPTPAVRYVPQRPLTNLVVASPGILFTAIDDAFMDVYPKL